MDQPHLHLVIGRPFMSWFIAQFKQALAHTEDEKKIKVVTGTKVGYILLPFSIAMRNDPLEYIHNVKSAVDRRKSSLEASFSLYITGILLKYSGFKVLCVPS